MMKSFLDPTDSTRTKTPLQNRRINGAGSARRSTPHKARYLPYRGDSPHIGKRTGITISPVPRDEDGFEPFEEVLKQVEVIRHDVHRFDCQVWVANALRLLRDLDESIVVKGMTSESAIREELRQEMERWEVADETLEEREYPE